MDGNGKRTIQDLQQMQAAPLGVKVGMTIERIRNWVDEYGEDGVCISFSGGKDSAVLMDIARKIYPNMKAAFVDTGLEYPEIREWVKQTDNVEWIKPKKTFKQVILKYGYPMISKEVSEVVYGAKKHIGGAVSGKTNASINSTGKGDTTKKYQDFYDCLMAENAYRKRGSYQFEMNVLMGLGNYQKRGGYRGQTRIGGNNGESTVPCEGTNGMADERQKDDSGAYP